MKLFFIQEKWTANIQEYGASSSDHILLSAFDTTGLGSYRSFHFDEYYVSHSKKGDFRLLEEIIDYKPDLVVYSWLVGIHNPEVDTIKLIHKMGHKVACIWWDFMWQPSMQMAEILSPYVDMHIVMDNPFSAYQIPTHSRRKHLPLWTPNDPTLYYGDPLSKREIDVRFSGSEYKERKEYIDELKKLNYNIFIGGDSKDQRVPVAEYTKQLRQTKIIPNFTNGNLKGRVFEATLSGALLMELEKSVCSSYFFPGKEYVSYKDKDDFIDKLKYYLEHDKERIEIAKAGHKRAKKDYNVKRFWQIVFNKLGLLKYIDTKNLYKKELQIDQLLEVVYNPPGR